MGNLIQLRKHLPLPTEDNPFLSLQSELNRLDRMMSRLYQSFERAPFDTEQKWEGLKINPSINIFHDKDTYTIEAEMPGLAEDDIKVSLHNGMLIITGDKETSTKMKEKDYLLREVGYGHYERHLSLPEYLDADKATATFKKGMLWITFPKKAGIKPTEKDIPIKHVE